MRCTHCRREMDETTDACSAAPIAFPDGDVLDPVPHGGPGRCPDCACAPGGVHHPGYDRERCPRCGRQRIGCGCVKDPEDPDGPAR